MSFAEFCRCHRCGALCVLDESIYGKPGGYRGELIGIDRLNFGSNS